MSVQPVAWDKEGWGAAHWMPSGQVCGHRARVLRVEPCPLLATCDHPQRNRMVTGLVAGPGP